MEIGKTVITNAAAAYGFYDCDNLVLRDWSGAFGAGLEYLALSANIVTINSTLNGATGDGINILSGGKVRINGFVVADAQGAAIADAAASVAAPTKAEFDALVGKFNAVLAQRRLGVTRQA